MNNYLINYFVYDRRGGSFWSVEELIIEATDLAWAVENATRKLKCQQELKTKYYEITRAVKIYEKSI